MDEPQPLTDLEIIWRERAFALLLGAIVLADTGHDVELAWRVAQMVCDSEADTDDEALI